jgi:hypothetical protein
MAEERYEESEAKCYDNEDAAEAAICVEKLKEMHEFDLQICCEKDAEVEYESSRKECNEIPEGTAEHEECHIAARETLQENLEECRPEPPTCWESAEAWLQEYQERCNGITEESEQKWCFE